jgi:predicted Rossmann fold nucleotide-binding protein DprA/Smf involved in DNA uptake
MKAAIIGSRSFNDDNVFYFVILRIFLKVGFPQKIISGGAKGADNLAKLFAVEYNYDFEEFLPDFLNFPPGTRNFEAPHARNSKIAESCDYIIAFWDMKSSGTKDTIDKSVAMGKKVYVYDFVNNFIYTIEDI